MRNKVEEPKVRETWQCPRCLESYCIECVDKHTVDFEILDNKNLIQWKGLIVVCLWCYNQLIDLKEGEKK